MNQSIAALLQLQTLELNAGQNTVENIEIKKLRKRISAEILKRYGELRLRGKQGVALVRNGVCGQCHMQLSIGLLASLHRFDDIHSCQNCGVYLSIVFEKAAKTPVRRIEAGGRVAPKRPSICRTQISDSMPQVLFVE